MSNAWIDAQAQRAEWPLGFARVGKDLSDGRRMVVTFGLRQSATMKVPMYWSITGEILRVRDQPLSKARETSIVGPLTAEIRTYFPEFSHIVDIHNTDDDKLDPGTAAEARETLMLHKVTDW